MRTLPTADKQRSEQITSRRRMVLGVGALAAGLMLIGSASAQAPWASKAKAPAPKKSAAAAKGPNPALVDAAKRCGRVGNICLRHCIRLTRAGDKTMAECLRAVQAMLPVCSAIGQLAGQDAQRLKEFAKVCIDVCSDCEDACRKHEFHHVECKNCAEACAAMIKECKAVIGA